MINITLRQLRYFEAVARLEHFGHAAKSCAISQPALSIQIKELEAELGTRLFERDTRRVYLTKFGTKFLLRVQDILRAVHELDELARASRNHLSGQLKIGVIPTIGPYLLPELFDALRKSHPELDLHVRETLTSRLINELKEGVIDTAIVALPVSEPGLTEVNLFDEPLFLIQGTDQTATPIPDINDLKDTRLLLLEEGHCFRDQALSYCTTAGLGQRAGLDASSFATLVQMVSAGIGATLLPEMAVHVETRSANVTITRFGKSSPRRTIGMIWRKTTPLADHLQEIANIVRQVGTVASSDEIRAFNT